MTHSYSGKVWISSSPHGEVACHSMKMNWMNFVWRDGGVQDRIPMWLVPILTKLPLRTERGSAGKGATKARFRWMVRYEPGEAIE